MDNDKSRLSKESCKLLCGLSILPALAATILTAIAFINNISIVKQFRFSDGPEASYKGIFPQMDWSAVDYSMVSTFIPFLGMLFITVGLFRILFAKKSEEDASPHFPFYATYNSFTVALGLMGTLVGLIFIGYFPGKSLDVQKLVICLKTALFSSLVAFVWIYFVAMPAGRVMGAMYRVVSGYRELDEKGGIDAALQDLEKRFGGCSASVIVFIQELKEALEALKEFKKKTGVDAYGALVGACGALQGVAEKMAVSADKVSSNQEALKETQRILQELSKSLIDFAKQQQSNQKAAQETQKALQDAAKSLIDSVKQGQQDRETFRKSLAAACDAFFNSLNR
jgi:gas vesicle protein